MYKKNRFYLRFVFLIITIITMSQLHAFKIKEKKNSVGYTELMQAADKADVAKMEELILQGADVNAKTLEIAKIGMNLLQFVIFNGNEKNIEDMVNLLLKNGADPTFRDNQGNTALHYAVNIVDKEVKRKIIVKLMNIPKVSIASINMQNNEGNTPMHSIVLVPQVSLGKFMLENFGPMIEMGIWKGIDSKNNMMGGIKNNQGKTVWDMACNNDMYGRMLDYLRSGRQQCGATDSSEKILGYNGLMLAIMRNDYDFANYLLEYNKTIINAVSDNGMKNTALHIACMRRNNVLMYIKLLLKYKFNTKLKNSDNQSPIDIIRKNKKINTAHKKKIIRLLSN